MFAAPQPLAGRTICYISSGGFGGVYRTLKQAMAVADAGARVVFVGYGEQMPSAILGSEFEVVSARLPHYRTSQNPVRALRVAANLTLHRVQNRVAPGRARAEYVRHIVGTGADIVQATDLPVLDIAWDAARRMGARLVYDSSELWYGFLDNPDLNANRDFAANALDSERRIIGKAGLVLCVSDVMGERLVERYRIPTPLTILNSPPKRSADARPVSSPVRLVFHGGLSADRNIDGLIRAMAHLKGRATLDVHGFSRTIDSSDLQALIDELGLGETVELHGRFDYDHIVELLEPYDVGVMAAKAVEENFEIALPNKLFDCMCAGLAVALGDTPAVRGVIEEAGCGIVLDPSTPETIARDLGGLIDDPERILAMKCAAVEAAPRYWWPEQGRKLVEALGGMLRR